MVHSDSIVEQNSMREVHQQRGCCVLVSFDIRLEVALVRLARLLLVCGHGEAFFSALISISAK